MYRQIATIHPLLTKSGVIAYVAFWSFMILWNAWTTVQYAQIPWMGALIDAFIMHKVYAVMGFACWPFMEQTWRLHTRLAQYVIIQLAGGLAVVALVTIIDIVILEALIGNNLQALESFYQSLPWRIGSGIFYQVVIVMMYLLVLFNRDVRRKDATENKLRESLKESELALLKSQFSPHFLFNSLNSASYLTMVEPEKAHRMIVALSEYLRYSLRGGGQETFATLESEVSNVRRYLEIEALRFGDRLVVDFQVDSKCLSLLVPSMILQPLFENAVKHGVQESTGQVSVTTSVSQIDDFLLIRVRNTIEPGPGSAKVTGAGHGIRSIRERLCMHYADMAVLRIDRGDRHFQVEIQIPSHQQAPEVGNKDLSKETR